MITNKGKEIIAKYLLGTAPAFASYIAIGCGPKPLQTLDTPEDFSDKETLDFEMFRIPIISRGYVNDAGTDKIILTAELPTEERYEISEIGVFSSGSNVNAGTYDSKTVVAFAESENWQYSNGSSNITPTYISSTLSPGGLNVISTYEDCFQTSADNPVFLDPTRSARYEGARYLNNMIMLRGNTSLISGDPGSFDIADNAKYVQLSGQTFNFNRNSSADIFKIAISLVNIYGNDSAVPNRVNVVAEFSNGEGTQYAKLEGQALDADYSFSDNRYFILSSRFDELVYSSTFSWDAMTVLKIYVSVLDTLEATNIVATTGSVTLTTEDHGIPVDASITNVSSLSGVLTYTSTNTFAPGDSVNISGITSTPADAFNISNAVVTEATSSYFKISSTATGTYTSGGNASIANTYINFLHETSDYTGTHLLTSVPSSTTLTYYVSGASLTSTALSPAGSVDVTRPEYLVSLDALRLDNLGTVNPLYGMTGYSIIQNEDAVTIKKNPNTNNYIEFRINIGVS